MVEPAREVVKASHRWRRLIIGTVAGLVLLFGLAQLIPIRVHHPAARVEPRWDSPHTRALVVAA